MPNILNNSVLFLLLFFIGKELFERDHNLVDSDMALLDESKLELSYVYSKFFIMLHGLKVES